jgi:hypothetical protein
VFRLASAVGVLAVAAACVTAAPPVPGDGGSGTDGGGVFLVVDGGCGPVNWADQISPIVNAYCLPCHGAPPTYGAPVSLDTYADTQQPSVESGGFLEYQVMALKVAAGQMPASGPQPTPDEIALIVAWADAGAPVLACPGMDAGMFDAGQQPYDAGLIDTSTANWRGTADAYIDLPDAGIEDNNYECFSFSLDAGTQAVEAIQFAPIVDNATILHHMVVYRVQSSKPPPASFQCFGGPIPPGDTGTASFLYGWAPGVQPWTFPAETGMPLQNGENLIVQIHYHNFTGLPQTDSSGVALWWTTQMRQYPASVMRLGPTGFMLPPQQTDTQISDTCTLAANVPPLHLFGATPHMHLYGTEIATQVTASGVTGTLVSVDPWNFNNQHIFPVSQDVNPGDQFVTTCHYNTESAPGPVYFGETTEDEMCFDFLYLYPLDAGSVPGTCP